MTTARTPAEGPDFQKAFQELEAKISRVLRFAQVLDYLATEDISDQASAAQGRHYRVGEDAGDAIRFLAEEAKLAAEDLEAAWVKTHNASCAAERAS